MLSMTACDKTNGKAEPEETDMEEIVSGGWAKVNSPVVTDNIKEIVEKGTSELTGAEYVPVAYLSSQVVAGMNYEILCKITPIVPDAKSHYSIVEFYEDLDGNVELTGTSDLKSEMDIDSSDSDGAWTEPGTCEVTSEAAEALEKATAEAGYSYTPIALLGTQVVNGTNYRLLCDVKIDKGVSVYKVVTIYMSSDGKTIDITDEAGF